MIEFVNDVFISLYFLKAMALELEENERAVLYDFAVQKLRSTKILKVADLASGPGEGTLAIAKNLPQVQVFGLDFSKEAVESARKNFPSANLTFLLGDVTRTPWEAASFDAVVSFHTIEHMDEAHQNKFMSEIDRILKPGGALIMATPDRDVWEIQGIAGIQEDHIRELSQEEFAGIISGHGFKIEGIYGQSVLKSGTFPLRRFLNFLKKLDVFKVRRIFKKFVDKVDTKTHPVDFGQPIQRLLPGQKASTTVIVCKKPS